MIKEKNLTIIMNGRYEKNTRLNILNVRKILPTSQIILSTYKDGLIDKEIYSDHSIELLINKDYGDYKEFPDNPKNLFRMMQTFNKGLKKSKNNFILRLRTDYSVNKCLKKQLKRTKINEKKIFIKKKMIKMSKIYSTNAAHLDYDNFHFSDQVLLSTRKQLKDIYYIDKKKFLKKKDFSIYPKINGKWGSMLASEQIIWINFLKRKFKIKDAFKIYQNRELHNQISKNIIIMNNDNFKIPKRLNNLRTKIRFYAMNNYNFFAKILRYIYFIKNN